MRRFAFFLFAVLLAAVTARSVTSTGPAPSGCGSLRLR